MIVNLFLASVAVSRALNLFNYCMSIFACLILTACTTIEPAHYIISEKAPMNIYIVFDANDYGVPTQYKDGSRIYRIDSTGVLYTQFSPNTGRIVGYLGDTTYVRDYYEVSIERSDGSLMKTDWCRRVVDCRKYENVEHKVVRFSGLVRLGRSVIEQLYYGPGRNILSDYRRYPPTDSLLKYTK